MSGANPGLAYEDTPPLSAPLRFFLSAPLFGILAGLVLLFGSEVLSSRWTPLALGIVHLFAAGFMLQVMLGALQQIMPVVAGAPFPAPLLVARLTHGCTISGALALAGGLAYIHPLTITAGALLLVSGIFFFLLAALHALLRAPAVKIPSHTPRDLRLALVGLALTAILGLLLALALAQGLPLPFGFIDFVDLHASWGWLGWGGLLLAATSWVVVPMFQITPPYPRPLTAWFAPSMLVALLLWSLARGLELQALSALLGLLLLLGVSLFAITTLRLQARTRRSKPDASFRAFRIAMLALLGGLAVLGVSLVHDAAWWPVLAAVLVLHGGFGGAITAMLYKIVPFLAWLHLSQAGVRRPPNVKKLLPDKFIRRQLLIHHLSLLALIVAALSAQLLPVSARVAGALMVLEFVFLLHNVIHVVRNWRAVDVTVELRPRPAAGGPEQGI